MIGGNLIRSSTEQSANLNSSASDRAIQSANTDDDDEIGLVPGFFESHFFLWISTTVYATVAVYSGVMASLLSIFVPQLCCPDVINAIHLSSPFLLILSLIAHACLLRLRDSTSRMEIVETARRVKFPPASIQCAPFPKITIGAQTVFSTTLW
jgi:hypothetical protein